MHFLREQLIKVPLHSYVAVIQHPGGVVDESRCLICEWTQVPATALFCVRCGSPVERRSRLARPDISNTLGTRLEESFRSGATIMGPGNKGEAGRPIAWTAFGDIVALLVANGDGMSIGRLRPASNASGAALTYTPTWVGRKLPASLSESLIAPPIASRAGISLVTTAAIETHFHADPHLPQSGKSKTWSASAGESICAATLDVSGDLFFATRTSGAVAVRDADGTVIARFETLEVPAGKGLGLAVRANAVMADRSRGSLDVFVWQNGQLSTRNTSWGDGLVTKTDAWEGLEAPALLWSDRAPRAGFASWPGAEEARSGVSLVDSTQAGQNRLSGLVFDIDGPRFIHFGTNVLAASLRASPDLLVLVDAAEMRVVDPRTGLLIAERHRPPPIDSLAILSCDLEPLFVSLTGDAKRGEVQMRVWAIRDGAIELGFQSVLALTDARRDAIGAKFLAPLQGVAPIETGNGLLIALEEGAGGADRVRIWHETDIFTSIARS